MTSVSSDDPADDSTSLPSCHLERCLMADVFDRSKRSAVMAAIRGRDTKPELIVRRYLHALGYRFRLHGTKLPGRPDIVLPRLKTVVFVHGCFWHRHSSCRFALMPRSNVKFWTEKLEGNVKRDARNSGRLRRLGWHVLVIWECQLNERGLVRLARKLAAIRKDRTPAAGRRKTRPATQTAAA